MTSSGLPEVLNDEKHLPTERHSPNPKQTTLDDSEVAESSEKGGVDLGDSTYQQKARLLNAAIQEAGMGQFQRGVSLSDNLWPIVTGLILDPVVNEFKFKAPYLKLRQNIGLFVGAAFWGVGADMWGKKISFNITLLITGVFALAAGGSNSWITLTVLTSVWSEGVGGNLPVDSAIFLEFLPHTHQYFLTVLSTWWALGQLIGSLIAWPLIGNFSCVPGSACPRSTNQGWRYFLFTMRGLMILLWAVFVFTLYESPKYLMGRGEDEKTLQVVHQVALKNRDVVYPHWHIH